MTGEDIIFITIYKTDRNWINETKGKLNRAERLHQIIEFYKTRTAGYIKVKA